MKSMLLFLLSAVPCFGQFTNLTFVWDASTNATGYRFYEIQSNSNRVFLGGSLLESFVVSNWNVSTARTVTVTSTNVLGESTIAFPLRVPPAPAPVQNLKPIPISIVTPVPGMLELSHDLADWSERIRFSIGPTSSVLVTWIQYPTEPMLFLRTRPPVLGIRPPLP